MEKKTHYAILGISPRETQDGVCAAFRKLAKQHHPDVSGPERTRHFQEITEAYLVLSRPESRKAYDETLSEHRVAPRASVRFGAVHGVPGGTFGKAGGGEPIVDNACGFRGAESMGGRFHQAWGGLGSGGFAPRRFSRQPEIEVLMTREEAFRGGILPLEIPASEPCPACRSRHLQALPHCARCGGWGVVGTIVRVRIRIPSGVEDGMRMEVRLQSASGREDGVVLKFLVQL